ncbi:MAG TPA: EamA family transporter RarD [Bacillota bacterium]|nr:EamA family transporter RarD [Bacillota bacterium]HPZ59361.1 EamA family transporter RarD [Bacillota bacterium]HQC81921.1 EamA family transporter RarD [Bacillota bacterium]
MIQSLKDKKQYELGMACAILCALVWGVLPIYWKALDPIDPLLIIFYRIVLTCIIVFIASLAVYKWKGILEPLKKKGAAFVFFAAGCIISVNWGLYIWMVNAGFIIQTSIGYYIEPLMVCVFGILFFKEKPERYKIAAILLALAGVCVMLFSYGQIPVLALVLALAFATYAALKKKLQAPALLALFYETVFLAPISVGIILYTELNGKGAFSVAEPYQIALLSLSGLFTAIPLSLFAMAANRISLIALGITEYIAPSIGLILGIFLYKEPFDIYQFIGFLIIWCGLAVFTAGGIRSHREAERQKAEIEPAGVTEASGCENRGADS